MNPTTIERIAAVCHEANRIYCHFLGDDSQVSWDHAPQWQRNSAINGVRFHLANPVAGADASHRNWLDEKMREGWSYGTTKDTDNKQHPCMVPFDQLPIEQQVKDIIFLSIVRALSLGDVPGALEDTFQSVHPPNAGQVTDARGYGVTEKQQAALDNSFTYHPPQGDQVTRYQQLRDQAKDLAAAIIRSTPPSREQSLALTNLEQAVMWANKAIACNE